MMSFPAANDAAKSQRTTYLPRIVAAGSKPKSAESPHIPQKVSQDRHNCARPGPVSGSRLTLEKEAINAPANRREVSRLELLLSQKGTKQILKPVERSEKDTVFNTAIRLSSQWTDVKNAVAQAASLSPFSAAYALHRLGCLNSFASRKRKADLAASGLVSNLLEAAVSDITSLEASLLAMVLDGCARLNHVPPTPIMHLLAAAAERVAVSFGSLQLPLVLWAFSVLHFAPPLSLLCAFDQAVPSLVDSMSPQGISLSLSSFQASQFSPDQQTLACMADALFRKLPTFKPSEIATCLEAFCSFEYQPADHIVTAVLEQMQAKSSQGQKDPFIPHFQVDVPRPLFMKQLRGLDPDLIETV